MIVWGVLTEQAIGKIFIGDHSRLHRRGILLRLHPRGGVAAAARVGIGVAVAATRRRKWSSATRNFAGLASTLLVIALIAANLGGIWLWFFTPTEGAGVGAALALLLALWKGLRTKELFEVVLSVGRTSAPLLLLLFCAQLYSRVLSMTGLTAAAKELFIASGLGPLGVLAIMVAIWFVLGMLIDSISIILLTVPVFAPIAMALGFDPLAFSILGILAIECGLLTPPFGMLVFTVKAALPGEATVGEIFRGSTPYWICLLGAVVVIAVYPRIATWLPEVGMAIGR
jgi:TRAP-type C4-dicarboxylate transport system permease large subunit